MRSRCNNPNHPRYADWGGRGITVAPRWGSFENFLTDMGERPTGTTLERKDNERGYEPSNCIWATPAEQARNTRATVLNRGKVLQVWALMAAGQTVKETARQVGIDRHAVGMIWLTIRTLQEP